jgi:hypothetical protein
MPNAWVEHVRKFASKNGMAYGCAVSDAECKASYHRQKARNAKKTRTPAQEMEGMGAEDMPVAEVAKRRRARVSKARQAQVAEADPPKKQKDFTYKTREEKLEYARLQDLAEKAAEKSKPKKRVTAAKKVIDNFDLLKMISGFVQDDGVEAYKGYSAGNIRKRMKTAYIISEAKRYLAGQLDRDEFEKKGGVKRRLGEPYNEDFLHKSKEEQAKMLKPYLIYAAHQQIDGEDAADKLTAKEYQDELKRLSQEKNVRGIKRYRDKETKREYYRKPGSRTLYGKIDGKWYIIGLLDDEGVADFEWEGAYLPVPRYKFFTEAKKDVTELATNTEDFKGIADAREEKKNDPRDKPVNVDELYKEYISLHKQKYTDAIQKKLNAVEHQIEINTLGMLLEEIQQNYFTADKGIIRFEIKTEGRPFPKKSLVFKDENGKVIKDITDTEWPRSDDALYRQLYEALSLKFKYRLYNGVAGIRNGKDLEQMGGKLRGF